MLMRDSELAIYHVSHAFHEYRQTHDLLNDRLTVWHDFSDVVNDSNYHEELRAFFPMFLVTFYADRIVFRYVG